MLAENKEKQIWGWLADVPDPEIPIVSVVDLGMIRNVNVANDAVEIEVSPTYSGCPATEVIESSILAKLNDEGLAAVSIRRVLSPPWTTDWISEEGQKKLRAYGIAPPERRDRPIACPRCESDNTELVSEFGSTACKASYRCLDCLEPFEYFKCL